MVLQRLFPFIFLLNLVASGQQASPLQELQRLADLATERVFIGQAALLVDKAVHPDVDLQFHQKSLDQMAEELRSPLAQAVSPEEKLRVLSDFIYGRWGFANTDVLPPDVFVGFHEVLEHRQWNCFGLVVLYLALGERLQLPLQMVSGRGHVFVAWNADPPLYVETTKQGSIHKSRDYLKDYLPFPCLRPEEYVPLGKKETVSVLLSQTALALQHQDRVQPALNCFQVALEFDPKNAEAHAGIGFIESARQNVLPSGEAFKRAIEVDPAFREAYGGLGLLLHNTGHTDAAIKAYQKAVELCPEEPAAVYNLAQLLYESEDFDDSIKYFQQYTRLAPEDPAGHVGLAFAFDDSGNLDGARAAYESALKAEPSHLDANINLGYVLERQEDLENALRHYRIALKAAPGNALALAGIGRVATARGDLKAARQALEQAIESGTDNASIYVDYAACLRASGDKEKALEAYEQAIMFEPDDEEAYTAAASLLRELGREEEAADMLEQAAKLKD